jgi:hypothetical protein
LVPQYFLFYHHTLPGFFPFQVLHIWSFAKINNL